MITLEPKKEIKYLIDMEKYNDIKNWVERNGNIDANCYGNFGYKIVSVYKGLWKNEYKSIFGTQHGKVRIRGYFCGKNENFFIEEKIKCGQWVLKHRCKLSDDMDINSYAQSSNIDEISRLNKENNMYFSESFRKYGVLTYHVLTYYREPWIVLHNNNHFRITFDKDIYSIQSNYTKSLRDIALSDLENAKRIFPKDKVVFEIKGVGASQLTEYMKKAFGIKPQAVSKFGAYIEQIEYASSKIDEAEIV